MFKNSNRAVRFLILFCSFSALFALNIANKDKINANAEKTAEAEKTKILENGKKQSDMRYQQIISEAKMNARRAELGAKEDVIEAAFNQAIGELKIKASGDNQRNLNMLFSYLLYLTSIC